MPEAIPLVTALRLSYAIPEGTPWPSRDTMCGPIPVAPLGYLHVREWSHKNNKKPRTVAFNCWLGLFPGSIKHHYHWFIPEHASYPVPHQGRPRKHQPQGAPSGSTQGAGESRDGRPATREAA